MVILTPCRLGDTVTVIDVVEGVSNGVVKGVNNGVVKGVSNGVVKGVSFMFYACSILPSYLRCVGVIVAMLSLCPVLAVGVAGFLWCCYLVQVLHQLSCSPYFQQPQTSI